MGNQIKKCCRLGLNDVRQLERKPPENLTIMLSQTVAGYRKIEFGRQIMGDLSYETGRVVGGVCKIHLSRQVSGNINYDMARSQQGNIKQFGRVIPGFVKEFGRLTQGTLQGSRVIAGF